MENNNVFPVYYRWWEAELWSYYCAVILKFVFTLNIFFASERMCMPFGEKHISLLIMLIMYMTPKQSWKGGWDRERVVLLVPSTLRRVSWFGSERYYKNHTQLKSVKISYLTLQMYLLHYSVAEALSYG